ncbi:MAG: nucleotidyltransferase [Oscillospiraceae bacterium]|nr:nucleotidyltransferase [Oscillospiraceae bacterium]
MNKPVLVVMAAGMGSRYGGLKQIDPVGPNGEIIIDYSLYDAKKAGFETVVFIIKKEIEKDFKESIGKRIPQGMEAVYVFQDTADLPQGYSVPAGRVKPWGTAHAVCAARDVINSPFVVINADDYYGRDAFKVVFDYLSSTESGEKYNFAMVAYELENTLTENGYVSRGVCVTDANDMLVNVTEHTHIEKDDVWGAKFTEDDGKTWNPLEPDTLVSMNMWGFTPDFVREAWDGFGQFLDNAIATNPLKGEYYLPSVVTKLIDSDKATVKVLHSADKWYGVTYKEDKPKVVAALKHMHDIRTYPENMWE